MKELHHNYIVFYPGENMLHYTPSGYYTICMKDLDNKEGILNLYSPVCQLPLFFRWLYKIHNSKKVNNVIKLPFKKLWYPFFFKNDFSKNKPLCVVLFQRLPIPYLEYLKKKYLDIKIVLIYRDLRKITEIPYPDLPDNPVLDLQFTIDSIEANKYGWIHFNEIESKIDVPISQNYPESDIFFAGKAKDRLSRLLHAYEIFTKAGLKCKYYLTGVPLSDRKELPGIEYADKFMPYTDMLYHTVNTRCVLEINQYEAVGYTSRFLEAVMFNKRLITDNKDVKKSKFYDPKNILCVDSINDIYPEFVTNNSIVDYKYKDEFSPIYLIEQIDETLLNNYASE